jgi:hypothetical protein
MVGSDFGRHVAMLGLDVFLAGMDSEHRRFSCRTGQTARIMVALVEAGVC